MTLEGHGIPCFLPESHFDGVLPLHGIAVMGFRVQVASEDEAVAREVLGEWQGAAPLDDESLVEAA